MMRQFCKQFVLVLTMTMLAVGSSFAADVALWGSTTCQKRFLEPGAKALAAATGVNIKVFGVGTGKGMVALLDGKTNVAITSNNLEGTIKSTQKVLKKDNRPEAQRRSGCAR